MTPGFQQIDLAIRTRDGRNGKSLEPLVYVTLDGETLIVPMGSGSDGASTPRFIWTIIPPFGVYWLAAFLHDWLYRYSKLPRWRCDQLLYEAMRSLGVEHAEAWAIYEGVHLGGQKPFDDDRAAQIALAA